MRGAFQAIPLVALLAACNPYPTPKCEITRGGVHLAIPSKWNSYPDVVIPLREGRFDDLVRTAPEHGGEVHQGGTGEPAICRINQPLGRSVKIVYPPRLDDQVWAEAHLYYDQQGRALLAEFDIVPMMP